VSATVERESLGSFLLLCPHERLSGPQRVLTGKRLTGQRFLAPQDATPRREVVGSPVRGAWDGTNLKKDVWGTSANRAR